MKIKILILPILILLAFNIAFSQDEESELQLKYKELITLQLSNAALKQILSTFSQIGNVSILFDETVSRN